MSKFTKLELLDYLRKENKVSKDLSQIAIISVQHLLETTGSLFESILDVGFTASQILLLGKLYSNNLQVIGKIGELGIEVYKNSDSSIPGTLNDVFREDCLKLWERALIKFSDRNLNTLIVLDDGGMLISTIPDKIIERFCVIGVEQTTSGMELNQNRRISIISVAGSAIKKYIEPRFISQAIIRKIKKYLLFSKRSIGVYGMGNIGSALVNDLARFFQLKVYDIQPKSEFKSISNVKFVETPQDLFLKSDLIIGTTGKDVSKDEWLECCNEDKLLMSVSSGDVEFRTLLRAYKGNVAKPINSLLDNVTIKSKNNNHITILRGGTPINFDNSKHSVLPEYIQLTRALLFAGVIQAVGNSEELCKNRLIIKLDPNVQRKLLKHWTNCINTERFEFSPSTEDILKDEFFMESESLGVL